MSRLLRLWAALLGWIAIRATAASTRAWVDAGGHNDGRHNWPSDREGRERALEVGLMAWSHRYMPHPPNVSGAHAVSSPLCSMRVESAVADRIRVPACRTVPISVDRAGMVRTASPIAGRI